VIHVPPLRERRDDIVLLALSMLKEQAPKLRITADAAEVLSLANWDGNLRNLRFAMTHAVERAIAGNSTELHPEHLPDLVPALPKEAALTEERIRSAMAKSDGVAKRAAEALGVSRTTLYNALKRLNIETGSLRGK
jgi:transcriptional regulator of acetoin/glycerol metabolism